MGKNVVIMAFGDHLKTMCLVKDGISYYKLFYDKDEPTRKTLQIRGMKEREIDDSIFVKMTDCHIKIAFDRKIDVIIISDLRFKIEFDYLRNILPKGSIESIIVRIDAADRTLDKMLKECNGNYESVYDIKNHISETDLDSCLDFDYYLDNDYNYESSSIKEISDISEKISERV